MRAYRYLVHLANFVCLVLLLLLPASKYAWMADLDPEAGTPALEDGSGNRLVFMGSCVAVAFVLTAPLALGRTACGPRERGVALLAMLALPLLCYFRFAR